MSVFIKNYILRCNIYQSTKNQPIKSKIPIHPIIAPEGTKSFEVISLDFIVELPESGGFNVILVIVDQGYTKMTVIIPCTTKIDVEETAWKYTIEVWKQFGLPKKIISDQESNSIQSL